jgi:hypothetical protein
MCRSGRSMGGRAFVGGPLRHQQSLYSAFLKGSPRAAAALSRCHTTKRNMILEILNDKSQGAQYCVKRAYLPN